MISFIQKKLPLKKSLYYAKKYRENMKSLQKELYE